MQKGCIKASKNLYKEIFIRLEEQTVGSCVSLLQRNQNILIMLASQRRSYVASMTLAVLFPLQQWWGCERVVSLCLSTSLAHLSIALLWVALDRHSHGNELQSATRNGVSLKVVWAGEDLFEFFDTKSVILTAVHRVLQPASHGPFC